MIRQRAIITEHAMGCSRNDCPGCKPVTVHDRIHRHISEGISQALNEGDGVYRP